MKITHIITGTNVGGAELVLYNLLCQMDRKSFQSEVISLIPVGKIGKKIEALGIPVYSLGMQRGVPNPVYIPKLAGQLRRARPSVVHTLMYHANVVGGLAAKLAGDIPVIWAIHNSNLDPQYNKRSTLLTVMIGAWLNRWLAQRVVSVSRVSLLVHARLGYSVNNAVIIPNGCNLDLFKPDELARIGVRQELAIAPDTLLIGLVARFDPQKDHENFIRAAGILHEIFPDVHFLLCGKDITWNNSQLIRWIETAGIRECCHLLGERDDVPRLQASLDIGGTSSFGEAFPNVVAEAMACGVPCVVTNVGDSAYIVGETGLVVPPKDPRALAMAWKTLIELGPEGRKDLGMQARQRIAENFSLSRMTRKYEELYREVSRNG